MRFSTVLLTAAAAALCVPALAAQNATTSTTTTTEKPKPTINQRRENQQQRIGNGIENGSLTSAEAARLEHKEAKINEEIHEMKSDGTFTAQERAKVQKQQSAVSKSIYVQKHDAQNQNLDPKSEVGQRQLNQQQRIADGVQNGSLNAREAARMEARETAVNKEIRKDRRDGGGMTNAERAKINRQQNRNSKAVYRQKHDWQHR